VHHLKAVTDTRVGGHRCLNIVTCTGWLAESKTERKFSTVCLSFSIETSNFKPSSYSYYSSNAVSPFPRPTTASSNVHKLFAEKVSAALEKYIISLLMAATRTPSKHMFSLPGEIFDSWSVYFITTIFDVMLCASCETKQDIVSQDTIIIIHTHVYAI